MSLGRKTDLFLIFKAKKIESLKTMFPKLLDNTSENKSFSQYTLSLPPQNIRKLQGFLMILGIREKLHWDQMG